MFPPWTRFPRCQAVALGLAGGLMFDLERF
jgi:hypothetical protein